MFLFSHSDYRSFVAIRNQAKSFILKNKTQRAQSIIWGEAEGTHHVTDDVQDPFTDCCTHGQAVWAAARKNTDLELGLCSATAVTSPQHSRKTHRHHWGSLSGDKHSISELRKPECMKHYRALNFLTKN